MNRFGVPMTQQVDQWEKVSTKGAMPGRRGGRQACHGVSKFELQRHWIPDRVGDDSKEKSRCFTLLRIVNVH